MLVLKSILYHSVVKRPTPKRKGATWISKLNCIVLAHGEVLAYELLMTSIPFSLETLSSVIKKEAINGDVAQW